MSRVRILLLLCAAAALAAFAAVPAVAATPPDAPVAAAAAAKKKCKKGSKLVKVRKNGRTRKVCRKRKGGAGTEAPAAKAGPSVAEVEAIIRGIAQANHQTWLGPESMQVTFEQPTRVGAMEMYDPYGADPLNAGGPVEAWPVKAWTKVVDTSDGDVAYGGCLGHLNSSWPYDSHYMFFRGQSGEWTYLSSSVDGGRC